MSYVIVQGFPIGGPGAPGAPDNSLPVPPPYPANPWVPPPPHPWLPGHLPSLPPVDLPPGIGVNHPLFWLIPLLLRPATSAATLPPPSAHPEKPDPTQPGEWVMVALGAGVFRWAWIQTQPPEPK